MGRGRTKRYRPHVLSNEDLERADAMLEEYGTNQRGADAIRNDFLTFSSLNGLRGYAALHGFLGQMIPLYLPGSLDTYIGYVAPLAKQHAIGWEERAKIAWLKKRCSFQTPCSVGNKSRT
jgi:hypothetical protein